MIVKVDVIQERWLRDPEEQLVLIYLFDQFSNKYHGMRHLVTS